MENITPYPIIHILNDKHEVQNILREDSYNGIESINSLAEDLINNDLYKITQNFTKDLNNNIINVTHVYII